MANLTVYAGQMRRKHRHQALRALDPIPLVKAIEQPYNKLQGQGESILR